MALSSRIKILFGMRDDGQMTEPMGLMLLSALAKKHFGAEIGLWVMERDDLTQTIKTFKPDLVAMSGITGSHKYYIDAAYKIKILNERIKIIVGGPHFTFFPEEILKHKCLDALCVGEGDDAWVDWLSAIINNGNQDEVLNIITRENMNRALKGGILNPEFMRGRKTNLDDLPFLDRELVYENTEFRFRPKRTIMASRGCPFRCAYCFEHQWNKMYSGVKNAGAIRQFYSVDRLLAEIEDFTKRYDTRFIKFYDDIFPPLPNFKELEWHEEFCEKYPKRIQLPFHVLTRCDLAMTLLEKFDIDILSNLKKAGMASVSMSIESGNQFIRDNIITRDMKRASIEKAFAHAWKIGLPTFSNTILGIPAPVLSKLEEIDRHLEILAKLNGHQIKKVGLRENYKDYDKESVKFTLAQKPGFPEFPILFPYPKTRATDWCLQIGAFDGNFEKLHESYQETSYLDCYDDEYKKVMHNLELLGSFCALFAGSRNSIMQWLDPFIQKICLDWLAEITHPKATRIYGWLYVISKDWMHSHRTYPMKMSFKERIRFLKKLIELDFFKQFKERKPAQQTLGGPPSI